MSELIRKVETACAFGTPNSFVTMEIVDEIKALQEEVEKYRGSYRTERLISGGLQAKVDKVREALDGWQNLLELHQLANKIQGALDD